MKRATCACGVAIAASLAVLLVAASLLGFRLADWTESDGRIVGIVATVAAIAGAVAGLHVASRMERQAAR
jgi:uncharacterized membrane protein YfcA